MKPESTMAKLLAKFGMPAPAEAVAPEANEALAALQNEFNAFRESAQAELQELSANLETALNAVKEVEAQRDEAFEKLSALEAAAADAAAKAEAAKADARKQKIIAAVGTERADAVITATAGLTDENFEAVLGAMKAAGEVEAKSPMFNEVGAGAEANAAAVADQPSKEMQILRSKYANAAA